MLARLKHAAMRCCGEASVSPETSPRQVPRGVPDALMQAITRTARGRDPQALIAAAQNLRHWAMDQSQRITSLSLTETASDALVRANHHLNRRWPMLAIAQLQRALQAGAGLPALHGLGLAATQLEQDALEELAPPPPPLPRVKTALLNRNTPRSDQSSSSSDSDWSPATQARIDAEISATVEDFFRER